MILNIKKPETWVEKIERQAASWERWFAWYPVRVSPYKVAWMETVERRLNIRELSDGTYTEWMYRECQ